jgi:hypothetical protein
VSKDVLVQSTWELPVVIQWPDSTVKYEFQSSPGNIWFGVLFVAAPLEGQSPDSLEVETVEELSLVPSGSEAIHGSFELQCEGVVFFLWDNSFDWSSTKKLSYNIVVHEVFVIFISISFITILFSPVFRFLIKLEPQRV